MSTLNLFICENFICEYEKVIKIEDFNDVKVISYPCMCENRSKKSQTIEIIHNAKANGDDSLCICGKNCDITTMANGHNPISYITTNYCFNHLASEQFLNYIISKGGYVIGLGWLKNWRYHIESAGFDQVTARQFYKEFCKELVFFDAGIYDGVKEKLDELSEYLGLPYIILTNELDSVKYLLRSVVYEWRLQKINKENEQTILGIQAQCAEHSAVLDILGKMAEYTNRRETIQKVKEIFMAVLGAQNFKYWSIEHENYNFPIEIKNLLIDNNAKHKLCNKENRFCIKIEHNHKVFGVVDVCEFIFPQYIEKYFNFAIEIARISGLVLSNIEQYEKLLDSEKQLQYLSYHDSLTGLYNRTYLNEIIDSEKEPSYLAVFMFDIDKLKYINDNYGHAEGDKLILSAANILKKSFREEDVVARIGGDEFVALLPQCDIEMANSLKNRIEEAINEHNRSLFSSHLKLSVSIGFSLSNYIKESIESIMKKADEHMFIEKRAKRN